MLERKPHAGFREIMYFDFSAVGKSIPNGELGMEWKR
jgi:hypothetical protein